MNLYCISVYCALLYCTMMITTRVCRELCPHCFLFKAKLSCSRLMDAWAQSGLVSAPQLSIGDEETSPLFVEATQLCCIDTLYCTQNTLRH